MDLVKEEITLVGMREQQLKGKEEVKKERNADVGASPSSHHHHYHHHHLLHH